MNTSGAGTAVVVAMTFGDAMAAAPGASGEGGTAPGDHVTGDPKNSCKGGNLHDATGDLRLLNVECPRVSIAASNSSEDVATSEDDAPTREAA